MWVCAAANESGIAKWAISPCWIRIWVGCVLDVILGGSVRWVVRMAMWQNPSALRNAKGQILGPWVILWILLGGRGR